MIVRETIYAALFAKFSSLVSAVVPLPSGALKTASRHLKHWDETAPEDCPALFQSQKGETVSKRERGLPTKWKLDLDLYLYVRTNAQQDPTIVPSQLLNPLLDAIEGALAPDNAQRDTCTLGGLVSHCWISGAIETFEGVLGDLEVAIIPIEIVVAS